MDTEVHEAADPRTPIDLGDQLHLSDPHVTAEAERRGEALYIGHIAATLTGAGRPMSVDSAAKVVAQARLLVAMAHNSLVANDRHDLPALVPTRAIGQAIPAITDEFIDRIGREVYAFHTGDGKAFDFAYELGQAKLAALRRSLRTLLTAFLCGGDAC